MTPVANLAYVTAVLTLYTALPDTPNRASAYDKNVASAFLQRDVPLQVVESALLLGSLRRSNRPGGRLPLPAIRSLAYFSPVVDELLRQPLSDTYLDYLRSKAERFLRPEVQKSTFSHDR
jgi:hypothetical protein